MSKINKVDEIIHADSMIKLGDFLWKPIFSTHNSFDGENPYEVDGPYCRSCKSPFWPDQSKNMPKGEKILCDVCGKKTTLKSDLNILKVGALKSIYSYLNSDKEVISLNNPVSNVFDKEQDDNHIVKVFLSQKDGKKTALVYIIEKDGSGDKIQMFLDVENEQVRFDPNDLAPVKMIAKMKVEFKDSNYNIDYKKK